MEKKYGYVSQNIFLIDDTIEKNIAFGQDNIDEEKLNKSLKNAELYEYINNLDNKAKTPAGELGKKLSGGQRQRIGIARALYNDPPIIVFDEATNALDNATEENIIKTIYGFKKLKTILIISHKLKLLEHCDKIYKIENLVATKYK